MQQLYFQLLLGFSMIILNAAIAIPDSNNLGDLTEREPLHDRIVSTSHSKQTTQQDTPISLFQQLNLSHQQKRKIKRIRQQYQAQIIQLKENLQLAQQQLAAMMAGTDSAAVIRAKHEEIAQFRQQLATLHFESMLATREILTPQQRQKFAEIIEARQ